MISPVFMRQRQVVFCEFKASQGKRNSARQYQKPDLPGSHSHNMLWSLRLQELHIRRDTDTLRKDMRTATSSKQEDEGHPYSYNTRELFSKAGDSTTTEVVTRLLRKPSLYKK